MKLKVFFLCLFVSMSLYATGIENQKAPSFGVDTWIQTNGKKSLDIEDFKGKVLYLYGFQSWCPGCHKHGFPTLKELAKHYKGDDKVAFVAIQSAFEGHFFNSVTAAEKIISLYSLDMPVGHSGSSEKRSEFMLNYRTGGTPWTVIIDKNGIVRYNNFHAEVDDIIKFMDKLKQE